MKNFFVVVVVGLVVVVVVVSELFIKSIYYLKTI